MNFLIGDVVILCSVLCTCVHGGVVKHLPYRLDIVHFNDFHDRFEETSVQFPICQSNDSLCLGGFPRLYQETRTLLQQKKNPLLLNAGDNFQGTYWYTLLRWDLIAKVMNMLPFDAHTIGNHEFDSYVSGLAPFLAALRAPVLVANMNTSAEPSLNGLYQPHVIVEKNGRKIGIIGLITPATKLSSNSENTIFLDPLEVVNREAQVLTDQGVDIIIVLSHCGFQTDMMIAERVGDNIDVIVGGHSHSLLYNGDSPSNEPVDGPYPVVMEPNSRPGHTVLIVTASAYSKYLGNLTVYFDGDGEVTGFDGMPVFLNRSIPEDASVKKLLQPYYESLQKIVQEVVGYSTEDLLSEDCGKRECAFGSFIADSYLFEATRKLESEGNPLQLPHVAFLMRNMIRGNIRKGNITRGSILTTLPFGNQLVTFVLQGRYLLEGLTQTLKVWWVKEPFDGPFIPSVAGMKLTLLPSEGRVVSVLVWEGERYTPLEEDRDYQVTVPDFLVRGGNGFEVFKAKARSKLLLGTDALALERYVKLRSPIQLLIQLPAAEDRITIINNTTNVLTS